MTSQLSLYATHDAEHARLNAQEVKMLALFQERGRLWTSDLRALCAQYNARLHYIRKAGHVIRIVIRNRDTGNNCYELQDDVPF